MDPETKLDVLLFNGVVFHVNYRFWGKTRTCRVKVSSEGIQCSTYSYSYSYKCILQSSAVVSIYIDRSIGKYSIYIHIYAYKRIYMHMNIL